jgi:phage-related protein
VGAHPTSPVASTVRFAKAVYGLHSFQRKSPIGIRTTKTDVNLTHERLITARADYEVRYGKENQKRECWNG